MAHDGLRIDRLLFFLRFAKSRNLAQNWAEAGRIRINGCRVEKASMRVNIGDVITLPRDDTVTAFRLLDMPERRGPPAEAQSCYQVL